MENKIETTTGYWGYIRVMENEMETTTVYWGYLGIMEKKMETTTGLSWSLGPTCRNSVKLDYSRKSKTAS